MVSLIDWNPSFSVGDDSLDADHRVLLDILNRLYEAWQARREALVIGQLFDELEDYTATHFSREEALMMSHGYDQLDKHMVAHRKLRDRVAAFRKAHLAGGEIAELTGDATEFLSTWLTDHILGTDMLYKPALERPRG